MSADCELIQQQMGELFHCQTIDRFTRIRTPFMYPDGDYIDVFLDNSSLGESTTLTDLGETIRWLKMQTTSLRRSAKQNQLVQDICLTHGVQLYRGMLQLHHKKDESLALAVTRLAQAALRTADLWFTYRTRTVESVSEEVADFLTASKISYERGVKLLGRSGKAWNVDFQTWTNKHSAFIYVLSTGSKGATRRITEHVVAAWHDLSQYGVGQEPVQFISLFDDTADVWSPEDFRQLEDLSEIIRWSEPEDLVSLMAAA